MKLPLRRKSYQFSLLHLIECIHKTQAFTDLVSQFGDKVIAHDTDRLVALSQINAFAPTDKDFEIYKDEMGHLLDSWFGYETITEVMQEISVSIRGIPPARNFTLTDKACAAFLLKNYSVDSNTYVGVEFLDFLVKLRYAMCEDLPSTVKKLIAKGIKTNLEHFLKIWKQKRVQQDFLDPNPLYQYEYAHLRFYIALAFLFMTEVMTYINTKEFNNQHQILTALHAYVSEITFGLKTGELNVKEKTLLNYV